MLKEFWFGKLFEIGGIDLIPAALDLRNYEDCLYTVYLYDNNTGNLKKNRLAQLRR
jgi:hypothetical protein